MFLGVVSPGGDGAQGGGSEPLLGAHAGEQSSESLQRSCLTWGR